MRPIDRILNFVNTMDELSEAEREVLRYRIEQRPDHDELQAARVRLAPIGNNDGWDNIWTAPPTPSQAFRTYDPDEYIGAGT